MMKVKSINVGRGKNNGYLVELVFCEGLGVFEAAEAIVRLKFWGFEEEDISEEGAQKEFASYEEALALMADCSIE